MITITAVRNAQKRSVELNIAPLIDMVFILLIFFLVTTSFVKETGMDINRPSAQTAVSKPNASLLIAINRDGRIFMENREVDSRAIRVNVERAIAENPEGGVMIIADKKSKTEDVIGVLDACKLAGAADVSIAAGQYKESN